MTDPSKGDELTLSKGASLSSDYMLPNGQVLGQYRVLRPLGRGGMGEVYEVENLLTRKRYALKVLPKAATTNPTFIDRFRVEARVMSDLDHPHIVRVHHAGDEGGVFHLTMDLIAGPEGGARSLEDVLAQGRPDEHQVRTWALEICDALSYAHHHDVIHRDLKPSNILLDANNRVKVADFGLAKVVGTDYLKSMVDHSLSVVGEMSHGDQKTMGGPSGTRPTSSARAILGTYDYMAPEQKAGGDVSVPSDLYAVGVILYRLLTGVKPEGAFRPPSAFGVSRVWDPIVVRCLQPNPADRYPDAESLRRAILNSKDHRWLWCIAVAAALIAASTLLYVYFQPSRPSAVEMSVKPPANPEPVAAKASVASPLPMTAPRDIASMESPSRSAVTPVTPPATPTVTVDAQDRIHVELRDIRPRDGKRQLAQMAADELVAWMQQQGYQAVNADRVFHQLNDLDVQLKVTGRDGLGSIGIATFTIRKDQL